MDKQGQTPKNVPGWVTALAAIGLLGFLWFLVRLSSGNATAAAQAPMPAQSAIPTAPTVAASPKLTPAANQTAQVALVRYRIILFRTAQGIDTKMLMVDWKNTGKVPVRIVKADIDVYDASGNRLSASAKDHHLYAAARDEPGIKPGQTFQTKSGEGYILLSYDGTPAKVKVRVTSAAVQGKNI